MKKILIIGSGFAGLAAAKKLSRFKKEAEVTVIDKKTTFDFLPMLPDLIGRGISQDSLSYPIHDLSRRWGFDFINEEALSLDLEKNEVGTDTRKLTYDYLIIACGSETNFYGSETAKKYAYKLDDISDAQKILDSLRKGRFEHYLISGGGYTGIEIATNLRKYLNKQAKNTRIIIVEKSASILGPLPDWMKEYVRDNLKKLNIEIMVDAVIEKIEPDCVSLSDKQVFKDPMLIWAAGVKIADFKPGSKVERTPQGRFKVDEFLRLKNNCFVAGDAASFLYQEKLLRMAVQFSITQGLYAAGNIIRSIRQRKLVKYQPQDYGYVIPMANNRSCGRVFGINLTGSLPTLLHYVMCAYRSRGFKNKSEIINNMLQEV